MNLQDQIVTALATAAAAIVTALGSWTAAWVRRKVQENERYNMTIAAQSLANNGAMAKVDAKMDGLHDILNGGQIPAIVDLAVANSGAVKSLMDIAQRNAAAIAKLVDIARTNRADIDTWKSFCLTRCAAGCGGTKPAQPGVGTTVGVVGSI